MNIAEKYCQGVTAIHEYYQNTQVVTGDMIDIEMKKYIQECNKKDKKHSCIFTIKNINNINKRGTP